MKKLLLVVLGLIIIFLILQRLGFLTKFSERSETSLKKQQLFPTSTDIKPTTNQPVIGIRYKMIDSQTADKNNLTEGAYVTEVIKWSPAEKAGIREEDIILEIDEMSIVGVDSQTLYSVVSSMKLGQKINFKIWRNNEIKSIFVTLE